MTMARKKIRRSARLLANSAIFVRPAMRANLRPSSKNLLWVMILRRMTYRTYKYKKYPQGMNYEV
jgi:hypothetical protein